MSAPSSRPSGSDGVRASTRPLGVPASYLILTLIVANQAAARTDTSLPYLVQSAPQELRFARLPSQLSRPVRPVIVDKPMTSPNEHANGTEEATTTATTNATTTPTTAPGASTENAAPNSTRPQRPQSGKSETPSDRPETMPIIPDSYAPQTSVRIEDLLPFFVAPVPPQLPPSRATYEVK